MRTYVTATNARKAANSILARETFEGPVDYVVVANPDGRFSILFAAQDAHDVVALAYTHPAIHGRLPMCYDEVKEVA